jgi:presenilin-like A22 family membrane protease
MKHDLVITLALIVFFVLAQVVGLVLIKADMSEVRVVDGVRTIMHGDTSLGPRPEVSGYGAFAYIALGLIIGTLLVLLIIRMKKINLWKAWFFIAVFLAISLALGVFLPNSLAFVIALVLAVLKILKPNVVIQNITEVLMYAGIAVFLVPILNVLWAAILLLAISVYDIYAVFKSKHMVRMAKFQAQSKVFAGLFIPYTPKEQAAGAGSRSASAKLIPPKSFKKQKVEKRNAILGGGDIAFPLLFTGAVMESLVIKGLPSVIALQQSMIITITTTIALALLFIFAKKDKFYPAMPFVTAGCLIGYGIVLLF